MTIKVDPEIPKALVSASKGYSSVRLLRLSGLSMASSMPVAVWKDNLPIVGILAILLLVIIQQLRRRRGPTARVYNSRKRNKLDP